MTETEKAKIIKMEFQGCRDCIEWERSTEDEPCLSCRTITVKTNFKRREE